LVDTVSMALRHMRDLGLLVRGVEWAADMESGLRYVSNKQDVPLYPA
jgi:hypothetical protein